MPDGGQCRWCGQNTLVSGACISCGAGVTYRLPYRRGRRKREKPCRHEWGYEGKLTTETGVPARREVCTKCPEWRVVEVE